MPIESMNPSTGETIKCYDEPSPGEVAGIIETVDAEFYSWRRTSFEERAHLMKRAAQTLRSHSEPYARLMADEMGKPIREGRSEVEKCAWACEYYADGAERFLARETIETDATKSFVTFEPLGVVRFGRFSSEVLRWTA
jgi:succinate-semialdehyde dehydrogenase/glutarate-semialdehyde dehydrogenase